jgi:choline dehydrogenase-like flavoprotein
MNDENLALFSSEGSGPLTSNGVETGGFLRSREELPAPDLQFHVAGAMLLDEPIYEHGITIAAYPAKPVSRGTVTLRSPDPTVAPFILHNYYSEDSDLQTVMHGLRLLSEIAAQPALAPYTVKPYDPPASDSEEDLRGYVRRHTYTTFHPVGTCRMGSDAEAVVDTELRVQGAQGLRVIDASIMPTIVRGNTNAATIAIAERAADLIRGVEPLASAVPKAVAAGA